jgi:hypothetical protein
MDMIRVSFISGILLLIFRAMPFDVYVQMFSEASLRWSQYDNNTMNDDDNIYDQSFIDGGIMIPSEFQ